MHYLPTLYKARRVPTKQAVCLICVERTRGKTELVRLGYGVTLWLCAAHASREFQTQRSGRDFVLTLQRLWHAAGCLTAARSKALDAHLASLRGAPARPRPGSYTWPMIREQAERRYAAGAALAAVVAELGRPPGVAVPPSRRTCRRWQAERRWLQPAADPPSQHLPPASRHPPGPEHGPAPPHAPRHPAGLRRPAPK